MNKSTLFKSAHKIAKETVAIVGDYRIAFSLALKGLYAPALSTEDKLVGMGMSVWVGGSNRRIYINLEHLESVFGLSCSTYKSGSIKSATLNGEAISNSKATKMALSKHYYDCNAQKFVSPLNPII